MAKPKVRARYKVVGPKMTTHTIKKYLMDKETKSLTFEEEEVTEKTWMVYFPQGHSIRVNEG
jgi:predicted secreted protein